MHDYLVCPACKSDVLLNLGDDHWGGNGVKCPNCEEELEIDYDEDEDFSVRYWLTRIEKV